MLKCIYNNILKVLSRHVLKAYDELTNEEITSLYYVFEKKVIILKNKRGTYMFIVNERK